LLPKKVVHFTILNMREGTDNYFKFGYRDVLEERLYTLSLAFALPRNHFMYHLNEKVIQNLQASGVIKKHMDYRSALCYMPYEPKEWEPKVFKLNDLLFGFYIWLVACGVSSAVMAVEWTWVHGKRTTIRIVRNTVGLWIIIAKLRRGFHYRYLLTYPGAG
jgi:hypothetical protein